jgi:hypothetical protein
MKLSPELHSLIDALIGADLAGGGGKANAVRTLLHAATDEAIAQVSAIYLYGRNDDESRGETFSDMQQQERQDVASSGRERVIEYLAGKPFARYLPEGLKRAGLI